MSDEQAKPVKIVTQNMGNPDARKYATYTKLGGYKSLRKAIGMKPEEIIEEVKTANLRGRGGAGFPAGIKWGFVPKDAETVYLVVNYDEGEPGTFKDKTIAGDDPHRLIEGICIASLAIGAHHAFIYIRGELVEHACILEDAIEEAYGKKILGKTMLGKPWPMDVVVHRGAGAYICGEETSLLNSLEGRRGWPRLKPPFPAVKGAFGQPTIIDEGGQWFADLGAPGDGGTRCVAISGHVKLPGVYEVPVGTSLKDIIFETAGGMRGDAGLKAVIPGGSSTPVLTTDEIDTDFAASMGSDEKIKPVEVLKGQQFDAGFRDKEGNALPLRSMPGSGAIVVMEEGTDMVEVCARLMRFYAHESCGQCTPCREGTGWMARVCTRVADGGGKPEDIDKLALIADGIAGHTICPLGDAAAWPMLGFLTKYRHEFEARVNKG